MEYKGISFDYYNGRYIVISIKDLLKLGLVTKKTIQRGHPGYKKLDRLIAVIDKKVK